MSALPSEEPTEHEVDSGVVRQFRAGPAMRPEDLTWQELRDIWWLVRSMNPEIPAAAHPSDVAEPPDPAEPPHLAEPSDPEPAAPRKPEPTQESRPKRADPPARQGQEEWVPHHRGIVRPTLLDSSRASAPLRWPAVPALRDPRGIERALRGLTTRAESPFRKVLDEDKTATVAAENRTWLLQWKPEPWREFELALVVDSSQTLEIWRQTVDEFTEILCHLGAFRNVRTYTFDGSHKTDPQIGSGIVDPTGRRIVLVLTDAIGAAWRTGAAEHVIANLATRMPTAIVNVLDDRLWSWGGLSPQRVQILSPRPGVPNNQLWPRPDPADAVVVPVLALTPEWLSGWANLVSGKGIVETTAVHLSLRGTVDASLYAHEPPDPDISPRDRVLRFRTYASLRAFQLACLIAAAPLNLPIIRLVERIMLDGSDPSTVAEILLGGIVRPTPVLRSVTDPAAITYEFFDGVREELLAMGTRADTVRVARILSDYAGNHVPVLKSFRNAVDLPLIPEQVNVTDENLPFLKIQARILAALAGPIYSVRARSLTRAIATYTMVANSGADPAKDARLFYNASDGPENGGGVRGTGVTETVLTEGRGDMSVSDSPSKTEPHKGIVVRPKIWGSVPLRNPDFVGRDELLDKLQQRLLEPGTTATAVLPEALHGMGGVGKSQTVVEYIYRHSAEYDIIWWIPSEQLSQINASFVELAKKLGLPATSAETARPDVLEALRTSQRWLLVFDNADAPDIVSPFIPASSGHVIVTSRNSQWAGVARTVEVDLFTREESMDLLRLRGGDITDADANRLAEALGDLPLAVEQAAAWRAQTGMPVAEYLTLLERHLAELLGDEHSAEYGAMGYQRSVAAAWNVPLHRLRTSHPAALQLLQVCAFFGPEPISRNLFTGGRAVPVPEELANALKDPIKLNRAIREISRYSLAKIDHRNNTLQLHRLVQTVLKNQLSDKERDQMRHAVHILLVHGDPDDPEAASTWRRYAELLPHAAISKAVECQSDAWVRRLIVNLVRYLINSGDYLVALEYAREAMEAWKRYFGDDDVDTLQIARLRGIALWRLNRFEEAKKINEETYKRVREAYGDDNELYLSVADTLRTGMRSQGLLVQELEMQNQIFEKSKQIMGEDDPSTLRYANNLAGSLRLNGQFFKARDLDDDTWRRKKIVLGEDHSDTFVTLNGLAMDMRECGDYVEACRVQEENLARQRAVIGDDHPRTIGAMRNLAIARRKAGLHQLARDLSETCVKLYRLRVGDRHVDTVTAEMGLSADLRVMGELAESRDLAERSFRLLVELYGPEHPYTLVAAINYAVTLRLLKRTSEAKEINERTHEILSRIFDKDHPFSMVCATNLASDMAAMGDAAAAHALDIDTFERSNRVLGEQHPSTLAVALNLSIDLEMLGRSDEAKALHATTVANFRNALGPDHPATLAADQSIRANCDTDTMQL